MKVAPDPRFLEAVANHPQVFPYVSCRGMSEIRFGDAWSDCIGLEFDTGGFLFHCQEPGIYEVHTLFLPKSKEPDSAAKQALIYIFNHVGAEALITQIPADAPHVRRFALRQGFSHFCEMPHPFPRPTGDVPVDLYHLTKSQYQE